MPEECPQLVHDFGRFSWPNIAGSPVRPRFGPFFVAEHVPRPGAVQLLAGTMKKQGKKIRKMKALVIGATGAVGKDLVEQLLKVAQAMIRLAKADLSGTRTYDLKSKL